MGRKAKYRKYLILILLLACFVLALYVVCNTKNSLTFRCRKITCPRSTFVITCKSVIYNVV